MKFYIETIGCQQNEYDASRLSIFLKSAGFVETSAKEAESIFILACSVRQMAVDRIYGRVRNYQKAGKKVIITSCLTPEDQKKITNRGAFYWQFGDMKSLFVILGLDPGIHNSLVDSRHSTIAHGLSGIEDLRENDRKENGNEIQQSSNSSYVPIMTGCNNFCSYCIVPYTRGREKSRPVSEIIKEVSKLISTGKKQVILLGQNVNSYKNSVIPDLVRNPLIVDSRHSTIAHGLSEIEDLHGNDKSSKKTDFTKLLKKINDLPGDFEISFMSNHPKDMTEDVIEAIATLPKVKKEIHLPLQSGSDKILKAMNRPYTARQYLALIKKLKVKSKNIKITTDIIVGFPGETEEDFQKTVEVCKKVGYSLVYVNKYSPRKGTASYKLGDPIPWPEKQRRWKILDELISK